MPIHEFQCPKCGHKKEILMVKSTDWKGTEKLGCDKCKGVYKQVISAPSHQIHGFNEANGYSNKKTVKKKKKKDKKDD